MAISLLEAQVERSEALIAQTEAEGATPFTGSTFETALSPETQAITSLSTEAGDEKITEIRDAIAPPEPTPEEEAPPTPPPTPEDELISKELEATKSQLQKDLEAAQASFSAILDPYMSSLEARKRGRVEALKATFEAQKALLLEVNARLEKTVETGLVRTGGTRFTAEIAGGIMAAEQRASPLRIADLAAKSQSAIAEIEDNFAEKQFSRERF